MTQKDECIRYLTKWQAKLRLGNWRGSVEIVEMLEDAKDAANILILDDESRFVIRILDQDRWANLDLSGSGLDHTLESLVVHELCHLLLWPMSPTKPTQKYLREEEKAVHNITHLVMELDALNTIKRRRGASKGGSGSSESGVASIPPG